MISKSYKYNVHMHIMSICVYNTNIWRLTLNLHSHVNKRIVQSIISRAILNHVSDYNM